MTNKTQRYYVGVSATSRVAFRSAARPCETRCTYLYLVGPFRTRGGAEIMARYGRNSPHLQHVSDAEYYSRQLGPRWYTRAGFEPDQHLTTMVPEPRTQKGTANES